MNLADGDTADFSICHTSSRLKMPFRSPAIADAVRIHSKANLSSYRKGFHGHATC
jgi:hypothetical protein